MTITQLTHAPAWLLRSARQFGLTNAWGVTRRPHELAQSFARTEKILNQFKGNLVEAMPGKKITLFDEQLQEEVTFTLVPPEESDPGNGKLSFLSPLGSRLLGRNAGDLVEVQIFGRRDAFRIIRIEPN
ncbi:MAG: GreA/GreB family elongation factor [Cellvibrio sp.]